MKRRRFDTEFKTKVALESVQGNLTIAELSNKYSVWRISNTLDTEFCLNILEHASIQGKPEILNTDQGAQFTSEAWISMVESNDIKVSMDGKGRWADNVIIERFWRTLKHENILIHVYESVTELKSSIDIFIRDYNGKRLHQSLGYKTPLEVYSGMEQSISLVLGKSKPAYKKQVPVQNASGAGLLSSPFLGRGNSQIQEKNLVV